ERHASDGVAPGAADEERLPVGADRQAAGDELLGLGRDRDLPRVGQEAVGEVEAVDDLVLAAAGEEAAAVGGEADAVERLVDAGAADDGTGRAGAGPAADVHDGDFVFAEAGMQDREPLAARVDGD